MPIIYTQNFKEDGSLLVWKMTEDQAYFKQRLWEGHDWAEFETISHPLKQKEWLAGKFMFQEITRLAGLPFNGIHKDVHGKPFLTGLPIHTSISHTADYIAIAIHPVFPVGIDMEKPSSKLMRVISKFLTPKEALHAGTDLCRLARYWCAKESLFKLNGRKKVSFRQIIVPPFQDTESIVSGYLIDENTHISALITFYQIEDYCLSVAVETGRVIQS